MYSKLGFVISNMQPQIRHFFKMSSITSIDYLNESKAIINALYTQHNQANTLSHHIKNLVISRLDRDLTIPTSLDNLETKSMEQLDELETWISFSETMYSEAKQSGGMDRQVYEKLLKTLQLFNFKQFLLWNNPWVICSRIRSGRIFGKLR